MIIAGADGCKAGWLCISKDLSSGRITSAVYRSAAELIFQSPHPQFLMIDIPIGLIDSGKRECDCIARRILSKRSSCVFDAPVRSAIVATSRARADALSRAVNSGGVSAQAWGIYPKIAEVDAIISSDPKLQTRVLEIHPELCFSQWNGGVPIPFKKRDLEGQRLRQDLIREHFGAGTFDSVRAAHPRGRVQDDDIADAFAALWTAERRAKYIAIVIPEAPRTDTVGLRMEMWM